MNIAEIIILGLALAIDAMFVSFSYGLVISKDKLKNALFLAFAFGFFQFLMPVTGWFFTGSIYSYIKDYSKWVVFAVFIMLALKFLKEAFEKKNEIKENCLSLSCVLSLAIATSIDALGAGVSIRCLSSLILKEAVIIGIITFILSITGFYIAGFLKKLNSKYAQIIASIVFVYLAVKAL
jgi:putative Mn2+ efflux pump MntP